MENLNRLANIDKSEAVIRFNIEEALGPDGDHSWDWAKLYKIIIILLLFFLAIDKTKTAPN